MSEFQGVEIKTQTDPVSYGIAKLPGRKKVSLYREKNGKISSLAFFTNEDCATEFINWVENLITRVNSSS